MLAIHHIISLGMRTTKVQGESIEAGKTLPVQSIMTLSAE
jgi:hypothetical protein